MSKKLFDVRFMVGSAMAVASSLLTFLATDIATSILVYWLAIIVVFLAVIWQDMKK